jgi:hypothetical protein
VIVFALPYRSAAVSHNIFLLDLHVAALENLDVSAVSAYFGELHRDLAIDSLFGEVVFFGRRQIEDLLDEGLRHFYVDPFGDFVHVEALSNEDVLHQLL